MSWEEDTSALGPEVIFGGQDMDETSSGALFWCVGERADVGLCKVILAMKPKC